MKTFFLSGLFTALLVSIAGTSTSLTAARVEPLFGDSDDGLVMVEDPSAVIARLQDQLAKAKETLEKERKTLRAALASPIDPLNTAAAALNGSVAELMAALDKDNRENRKRIPTINTLAQQWYELATNASYEAGDVTHALEVVLAWVKGDPSSSLAGSLVSLLKTLGKDSDVISKLLRSKGIS